MNILSMVCMMIGSLPACHPHDGQYKVELNDMTGKKKSDFLC